MTTTIDNVIDSIRSPQTTGQPIPKEVMDARAVLGYSGHSNSWETFEPYVAARPDLARHNWVVPVTLSCVKFGHVYDIEPGGGRVENIGVFMHNAKNVWKTQDQYGLQWLYTFASNGANVVSWAHSFGYVQGRDYYLFQAHPNTKFGSHICAPGLCGAPKADGTQHLFAGAYDESILNSYMLRDIKPPAPADPYAIFPTDVKDLHLPNHGNERLTVEQTDGALEGWFKHGRYHDYLKHQLYAEEKLYRDRCMFYAKYAKPPRGWSYHHLGTRWQAHDRRMRQIAAIK